MNRTAPGDEKIHRVVSADGTPIASRVRGTGPPVVLLPAGPGDAATSWGPLATVLSDRYTCFSVDTRGRGLSDDAADHSPERLVDDVLAFADDIGEPVGLVGWGTGLWAHVAAQRRAPIAAVAAYEPGADEAMDEAMAAELADVMGHVGSLAAEGRLDAAAEVFVDRSGLIYTEEELDAGVAADFWRASAQNIGVFLHEAQLLAESATPSPTHPSVLADIEAPVLLLHGSRSTAWFTDSVRHVAEHVPSPEIREIAGAGHFGPITECDAVASEMALFFDEVLGAP